MKLDLLINLSLQSVLLSFQFCKAHKFNSDWSETNNELIRRYNKNAPYSTHAPTLTTKPFTEKKPDPPKELRQVHFDTKNPGEPIYAILAPDALNFKISPKPSIELNISNNNLSTLKAKALKDGGSPSKLDNNNVIIMDEKGNILRNAIILTNNNQFKTNSDEGKSKVNLKSRVSALKADTNEFGVESFNPDNLNNLDDNLVYGYWSE